MEEGRYYLILAKDINYLHKDKLWEKSEKVGKLLNGYRKAILTPDSLELVGVKLASLLFNQDEFKRGILK